MRFYLENTIAFSKYCQDDESWRVRLLDVADKAVTNTFIFTDDYEMERCTTPVHFDDKINWDYIPFGDNEWCFAFNRHTFLLNLAKAYSITRDEKYRDSWIRLFLDFYNNSPLSQETKNLSWRSLESGIRIENYIRSIEYFDDSFPLDESIINTIKSFFRTHITHLLSSHNDFHRLSNWGVLQDHGLLLASLFLEDKKSANIALNRLDEELKLQVAHDGMHWEQSSTYQAEVLHSSLDSVLVAERFNYHVPKTLKENVHKLALSLSASIRPDGYCHLFSDSDEMDVRDILLCASVIFNDGRLVKSGGNRINFYSSFPLNVSIPKQVEETKSYFFKDSGNAILNLSSSSQLFFHCGFYGSGHGHLDQLHFNLWNNGEEIITDSGRYTYTNTKERKDLKGTFGHNTIIINDKEMAHMIDSWGVDSFSEPLFLDANIDGKFKWLSAAHLGYINEGAFVKRNILTLDDNFVLIYDEIKCKDKAKVSIPFHFDNDSDIAIEKEKATVKKNKANITLFFDSPSFSLSTYNLSKHYNELLKAPLITREEIIEKEGLIVTVIALKESSISVKETPVIKPLSGFIFPKSISRGLELKCDTDCYKVSFSKTELPTNGFLSRNEDMEAYGRVFLKKNDEDVLVIKY